MPTMYRSWVWKPKSWARRLLRLRSNRPAEHSRTTESAAWVTTSTRCGAELESFIVREVPRMAEAGSVLVEIHAGIAAQRTAVTSAASTAKPSTGKDGFTSTGTNSDPRKASLKTEWATA